MISTPNYQIWGLNDAIVLPNFFAIKFDVTTKEGWEAKVESSGWEERKAKKQGFPKAWKIEIPDIGKSKGYWMWKRKRDRTEKKGYQTGKMKENRDIR